MRQFLPTLEKNYLCEIWQRFSLGGNIRLFIAEFGGRPVSAALTMAFGDTVTSWRNGGPADEGTRYPNEALHSAPILRAKSQVERYYDFGGIPLDPPTSAPRCSSLRKP